MHEITYFFKSLFSASRRYKQSVDTFVVKWVTSE